MYDIGIIGLGIMGQRMADAMAAHSAFRVVAGFDPQPRAALSDITLLSSPEAVIDHPGVDCVYIASPPASHAELVRIAAVAGKPIFCEKPLAASIAEARLCASLVRESGVPAAVNFPFATAATAVRLRNLVANGELGEIRSARLTLRFASWPRGWQAGAVGWLAGADQGGFTREVASHFLFLANRLFGRGVLDDVSLERGAAGTETSLQATISHPRVVLTIDAAVAGEADDYNRFEVVGDRDTAALTDWYRLDFEGAVSERALPLPSQLDGLAQLLAGTDQPLATFEEAAAVVEVVESILGTSLSAVRPSATALASEKA